MWTNMNHKYETSMLSERIFPTESDRKKLQSFPQTSLKNNNGKTQVNIMFSCLTLWKTIPLSHTNHDISTPPQHIFKKSVTQNHKMFCLLR